MLAREAQALVVDFKRACRSSDARTRSQVPLAPGGSVRGLKQRGLRPFISRELGEAEGLTSEPSLRLTKLSRFGAISMEAVATTTDLICANVA